MRIIPLTVRTPVDHAGRPRGGSGARAAAVDSRGGERWWSAGRRSAPEAGGSRKRIVLWRAPRPKRGRVATSVRVAWPTTRRLPALHSDRARLFARVAFRDRGFGKTRTHGCRENAEACPLSVTLRCAAKPRLEGRRPGRLGRHPSRLATLAPQDDGIW
jgi:hypothetical protein